MLHFEHECAFGGAAASPVYWEAHGSGDYAAFAPWQHRALSCSEPVNDRMNLEAP